jgi:hypothetical protein
MGGSRAKALLAMAVLVIVALAAGLTVWLTRDENKPATAPVRYSQLFQQAVVGKTTVRVLDTWPKPPYQTYHDNNDNRCYEWTTQRPPCSTTCASSTGS